MRTEQGAVHLTGAVRTEGVKRAAEKAAGGVAAVWEVESVLLAESAVAMAAASALVRDPRTSRVLIDVACLGGSVTLRGQVRTTAENAAAVEIASAVPGVAAVIDELEIRSDAARKRWPEVAAESLSLYSSARERELLFQPGRCHPSPRGTEVAREDGVGPESGPHSG